MTGDPTPDDEWEPRRDRRSAARPTRRRGQLEPPDLEPSERRLPAMASRRRYRGPLRRHDDRAEGAPAGDASGAETHPAGRSPRGHYRPDHSLEDDICRLLTRRSDVDAAGIEVLVEGSEVTLQGTVTKPDARWLLEELVSALPGVSLVYNRVRVADR